MYDTTDSQDGGDQGGLPETLSQSVDLGGVGGYNVNNANMFILAQIRSVVCRFAKDTLQKHLRIVASASRKP